MAGDLGLGDRGMRHEVRELQAVRDVRRYRALDVGGHVFLRRGKKLALQFRADVGDVGGPTDMDLAEQPSGLVLARSILLPAGDDASMTQ